LGDGMGLQQVNAARIYKGGRLRADELAGPVKCQTNSLTTDPETGALTITDSAAAATAIATGRRVYNGMLSISTGGYPLKTVAEIFAERGKSIGVMTNSYILDASPMAMVVHCASRSLYADIGAMLFGKSRPEMVLGGWMPDFDSENGRLTRFAIANGYEVITTTAELRALSLPWPSKVLGLFQVESDPSIWPAWASGLTPLALRDSDNHEPTLVDMTRFALDRLSRNENGFFLFIEGEGADTIGEGILGSDQESNRALPPEVAGLDDALGVVLDWVNKSAYADETLIVFGADHETGGYALHGDDVSAATYSDYSHTLNPVPYFATGPGASRITSISHLTDVFRLLIGTL
jgi:alkaline phosphatase